MSENTPIEKFNPPATTSATTPNVAVKKGDFRPRVELPCANRPTSAFAADLGKDLAKTKKFYLRNGTVVALDKAEQNLVQLTSVQFVTRIEEHVACVQHITDKNNNMVKIEHSITKALAEVVMSAESFLDELAEIKRINRVRLPKWGDRNGAPWVELREPGYDPTDKTYTFVDIEYPTDTPPEKGIKALAKLLRDVAWDPAEKLRSIAATLAMFFTAYCDELLTDTAQRPIFVVTANTEGAGKSLLVKIGLMIVYGEAPTTPVPAREKMVETLNANARAGSPFIFFDNWKRKIDDDALEAFASAPRWKARILGLPTLFDVAKRCLTFIAGNHAELGPDMRRRTIHINLFLEESRAENRKVSRELEVQDILDDRAEVLGAMWACVRYWRDRGNFHRGKSNRSFTEWGQIIGGIVECICSGQSPLAPGQIIHDKRLAEWERFLAEIEDKDLEKPLEHGTLLEMARQSGQFDYMTKPGIELLPRDQKSEDATFSKGYVPRFLNRRFDIGARSLWFTDNGVTGRNRRYMITRHRPTMFGP